VTVPLRTLDLTVGYRGRGTLNAVLKQLNLSVKQGELVCLLGPNGTGKSTLLRTLARIQPLLSGAIEIGGMDATRLSRTELARRLGIVLTERPMVGALSAYRLVELGRYPHLNWSGRLGTRDHEVVKSAIHAVGADHLSSRDISSLSDGERQRFMIARALAQEPSILLLDEPTAFLDVPSRVQVMGLLRRLARDEHLAIIVSTHDLELALRMADTLWLVAAGGKVHTGTPEDIILDGSLAEAFHGEHIRFEPEERAFRLEINPRGRAIVRGTGLHAVLAGAIVEREGYEVVAGGDCAFQVSVAPNSAQWEVVVGERRHTGNNFASLAAFLREKSPGVTPGLF
jgi:iron complex transport system ATP-binding protein